MKQTDPDERRHKHGSAQRADQMRRREIHEQRKQLKNNSEVQKEVVQ